MGNISAITSNSRAATVQTEAVLSRPGPVAIDVSVQVHGRTTDAKLVGRVVMQAGGGYLQKPSIQIDGKQYPLTDSALLHVLDSLGYTFSPGLSSRTLVAGDSVKDWLRKFVDFDGNDLALVSGAQVIRTPLHPIEPVFYHDGDIALNGPGLPEQTY